MEINIAMSESYFHWKELPNGLLLQRINEQGHSEILQGIQPGSGPHTAFADVAVCSADSLPENPGPARCLLPLLAAKETSASEMVQPAVRCD